jgi:hypothetical protein
MSFGTALQRAMASIAPCSGPDPDPSEMRIIAVACDSAAGKIAQSIRALWGNTDGVILP